MVQLNRQGRVCRAIFASVGGILLLLATVTLLYAALKNWDFTTATDYTFDSDKIDVTSGLVKLKTVSFIHDEEDEFSGTQSNTQWATDHIELDAAGLSSGSGTYTSQIIDSGVAGTQWGKISWTEVLSQDPASFGLTKSVGSLSTGFSVFGADIDSDDDIEVIVVQGKSPVYYFENNGAEAFTSRTIDKAKPKDPEDLHAADLNKDGRPDLVVVAKADLLWFENKGGTPPKWKRWAISPKPSSGLEVEVADINGDGNLDVIIGDASNVQWYENNGANPPSWTVREVDSTLSVVDALSTGDLDGDGDLDLLAGDDAGLYWYENSGANPPLFTKRNIDTTIVNAESIIAADLNNDGKLDVVGVGLSGLNLSWYENDGSTPPGFTKRTVDSGPLTSPVSVAAGDIDRDGDLDLALVEGADVYWYRNEGGAQPTWTKATLTTGTVSGGDHLFLVNLEDDVNGDDDLDIVVAEKTQVSWWENLLPHSNIRFQLRTSTDGTSWSSWQGSGGRTTSSYTDLTGETITVPNGRYIQYKTFFKTHNGNSLNAQLSMVRLDLVNQVYPTDNPTVQNKTGLNFSSISSFTETLGEGNQGMVKYQISNDGSVWHYYSGSLWVPAAQGFTHANSAAEVNTNISAFSDDVGTGTFHFKAFLNSDGSQQVELKQIDIDYSTVGSPTQLAFSVEPSNTKSKAAISPAIKVQLQDAYGNLVNTATNSITLAIGTNSAGANLGGTLTAAAIGGEATFSNLSIDKAGSGYTLVASVSGLTSATSSSFNVTAGAASKLVFSVEPSSAKSKAAISPAIKVQVKDAYGNLVTTATNSITLAIGTNPGGSSLGGTLTAAAVGGEVTFSNVSVDKIGTGYTLTAASGSLTSATSSAFNITAGAASKLVFSVQPSNTKSKAAISPAIKVQVKDANGNLVTTATDSITLAIGTNSVGTKLGGTLTAAAVGGEATFSNLSLDKAGNGYTLVASASGLTSATSSSFNITTGSASQLVFSVQPSNTKSKAAISPDIKVQVKDVNGNLVTTAKDTITLAIGTNSSGSAKLAGTLTLAAVGGEATFSTISVDKAGSGYTLVASASGLTSTKSSSFNISAGAASKLVFSVQPSSAKAKASISPAIKVQVQDANGNLITKATNTIKLAMGTNSSGSAKLAGTSTVGAVGGEATFSNISIDEAGSGFTLVASALGLTSTKSSSFNISAGAVEQVASSDKTSDGEASEQTSDTGTSNETSSAEASELTSDAETKAVDAANKLEFSVQPSSATARAAISPLIKVQVKDANGKLVNTTTTITLTIGTNPGGATLAGTLKLAAVGGEATFGDISIDKAGSGYTLVASASGLTSATSAGFGITEGQQLASGGNPGVPVAGSSPAVETVPDTAKQDAPGDETAVDSKEETGETSTKKDDKPKTSAKATDSAQVGSKAILEDDSNTVTQIPQKLPVLKDEPTTAILNREIVMETGDSVTIQLRAPSGTAPEIDVYDGNNVLQVAAAVMTEIGSTGVYEYTLNLDSKWGVGDFTVVASDSNRGTLNRMTLKVGAATSSNGSKIEADTGKIIPVLIEDVQTRLETVDTKLSRTVEEIRVSLNTAAETISADPQTLEIEPIHDRIREISNLLKQVSNENGLNLDVMYGSIDESTADFSELLDKVERLKVLLELNREVSEKVLEDSKKPVMKVWFESGSVILKILVVNPSKTETLTIPLIIKLPKEVSPEDIIDIGDLRLDYDMESGLYTVKNDLTLEPGQSMTKFVRMEDIWLFEEERLSSLVIEAEEVASRLEDTPFAEEAAALVAVIEGQIEEIIRKQEETTDSPGAHIRAYRQGLTTVATIKQDLSEMDSLGQESSKIEVPGKGLLAEGSALESGGSGSGEVAGSETPLAGPESQ